MSLSFVGLGMRAILPVYLFSLYKTINLPILTLILSNFRVVASAGEPTCCCFSPLKSTLVFAGMRDGSVVAWDLREPPTMHHSFMCGREDWLLRFPTYNTAGVLQYENHNSPVTAIVPLLTDGGKGGKCWQCATVSTHTHPRGYHFCFC